MRGALRGKCGAILCRVSVRTAGQDPGTGQRQRNFPSPAVREAMTLQRMGTKLGARLHTILQRMSGSSKLGPMMPRGTRDLGCCTSHRCRNSTAGVILACVATRAKISQKLRA